MSATLTKRLETVLDLWNQLPRKRREALADRVTEASKKLGELSAVHRELTAMVEGLEKDVGDDA